MLLHLLLLCSCAQTALKPLSVDPGLIRLSNLNHKPLSLLVTNHISDKSAAVGHQFLLFALPLGSVQIPDPGADLYNKAYESLSLAGYKISSDQGLYPRLSLSLKSISLSAYDLFFTRRVHAAVSTLVTLQQAADLPALEAELSCSESEFRQYGFEAELKKVYEACLSQSLNQVSKLLTNS